MTTPRTRTARKSAAPEKDLTALAAREPSAVNKAEAAWLVACAGLDVTTSQMPLVEKIVQLVAGSAHRAWQASAAAASVHATARANRPAPPAK